MLHPQLESESPPNKLMPPPQPQPSLFPKIANKMISQIKQEHLPEPSLESLHPQLVADKSLMFIKPPY